MLDQPTPFDDYEDNPEIGTSLRLLCSALIPLHSGAMHMEYGEFVKSIDKDVREGLDLYGVLEFLRQALGTPAGEPLLIIPMVDEGTAASGSFGPEKKNWDGHTVR